MSFMQSVSNIFGTSSAPAPSPAAPTPPSPANTDPNLTATQQVPVLEKTEVSPLDSFKTLWDAPTIDPKNPPTPDQTRPDVIFGNLSHEQMLKSARGVNFLNGVPEDLFTKITAGGTEAIPALKSLLNDLAQRAYAQASYAGAHIAGKGLAAYDAGLDSRLPSTITSLTTASAVRDSLPKFNHPAVAPLLDATVAKLQQQYPGGTKEEYIAKAKEYLTAVSGLLAGNVEPVPKNPQAVKDGEWDKFFS